MLLFFCPSLLCAFRALTVWNFPINELIPLNWEPEPFLLKFSCSRPCESSCSANFIRIYSRDNFVELAKFGAFFTFALTCALINSYFIFKRLLCEKFARKYQWLSACKEGSAEPSMIKKWYYCLAMRLQELQQRHLYCNCCTTGTI